MKDPIRFRTETRNQAFDRARRKARFGMILAGLSIFFSLLSLVLTLSLFFP